VSAPRLTGNERKALRDFIEATEHLLNEFDPEAVGRIADYVGEHGTDSDNARDDGVILECLRIIVDEVNRR